MRFRWLRCLLTVAPLVLIASAASAEPDAGVFNPPTYWPTPATGSDTCLNATAAVDHHHTSGTSNWAYLDAWSSCGVNVDSEGVLYRTSSWPPHTGGNTVACRAIFTIGYLGDEDFHVGWYWDDTFSNNPPPCLAGIRGYALSGNAYNQFGSQVIGLGTGWVAWHDTV
jgi:hypothetical protein